MKDKTPLIIAAALKVFLKKGYKESTTQEIAKEANVAEVTLFRKFANKQNLFSSVIRPIIAHQFSFAGIEKDKLTNFEDFIKVLINDRLFKISENRQVFRMLLAESIRGTLEQQIDLPNILFTEMKKAIEEHLELKQQKVNTEEIVRFLGGIFLSHLIWPLAEPYHKLPENQQKSIVNQYYQTLATILNQENID